MPSDHNNFVKIMQRSKPPSKRETVRNFLSRIFRLGPPAVPNAPQSLLGSGTPPVENANNGTHDFPSPPSMQTRRSNLNTFELNDGDSSPSLHTENFTHHLNMTSLTRGSSPSPPEITSSPLVNGTHTSQHVDAHVGDLNISNPIGDKRTSSSPRPIEPHAVPMANTGANIFTGAHHFVLKKPVFNVQGDSNTVVQGINALSKRVIEGAEYDSSLRDPPPQCHPGTRVELREKILTWFRNCGREKALLWLSGPAGVGKSAVIQTVAESLAESNSIGATLFFSRLNSCNDPQRVFITLAYQLATRIPAYQIYITGRIALDPRLLGKGMREQFRTFIAEPFGNNGIGKGEGTWAVMLDGLDECEGVDEQSRIVTLVSEFVLEFPNSPLIWTIASRPEPHIVATFNDKAVAPSYWSEYVPIDSTQACRDVEHYLDARFKAMRKPFPHLPPTWPCESQFLKLSNGARGLFVFARTAAHFMEDPDYADPVSRLNLILSIIDRLDMKLIDDHPFALLDALYTQMLTSIPLSVWPTTKRLLGFVICARRSFGWDDDSGLLCPLFDESCSLMGASIIFGVELSVAYAALHKLHSVLKIPDPKGAHKSMVTFLHASFGDYLLDRLRSKEFYIDRGEAIDEVAHGLFQLYLDKPWITEWERYTPHPPAGSCLFTNLKDDAADSLRYVLTGKLRSQRGRGPFKSQQDRSDCLDALSRVNPVELFNSGFTYIVALFMIELWNTFQEEVKSTGLFKEVLLRDLKVDYLSDESDVIFTSKDVFLPVPSPGWVDGLQKNLRSHPRELAMIYGSGPENRIALVAGTTPVAMGDTHGYFCFLYPY